MELFAVPELLHHAAAFPSLYPSPPPAAAADPAPAILPPPMEDVVAALQHAATSAKRLSSSASSADAAEADSAIASIRNAHRVIGSFLAQFEPCRSPPGDGAGGGDDETMGDDWAVAVEEAEASSDAGDAEEGTGESGLQSKRRKRPVPRCWPAGRAGDREAAAADPVDRRRSAMDIVFQFHG